MNNIFDTTIQTFLSQHAFASSMVNHVARVIAGQILFKGLVLVPVLCFIWFRASERKEWEREMVVADVDWDRLAREGPGWMGYWDRHVRGTGREAAR